MIDITLAYLMYYIFALKLRYKEELITKLLPSR